MNITLARGSRAFRIQRRSCIILTKRTGVKLLLRRSPNVGLDIRTNKLRLAWIGQKRGVNQLIGFESLDVPPGMVQAGVISNPAQLGAVVGEAVRRQRLGGRRVALSVPGSQVYMRRMTMPCLRPRELKQAVHFKAFEFLPLPVEEIAMDIFPLRYYQDDQGKKVELLFAAVRKQQVEALSSMCTTAGLKPTVIEIGSLAVYRAWGGDRCKGVILLQFGEDVLHLTIFSMGIPVYHRSLAVVSRQEEPIQGGGLQRFHMDKAGSNGDVLGEGPLNSLIEQIDDAIAYFHSHNTGEEVLLEVMVLDGVPDLQGWSEQLANTLNVPFEIAGQMASSRIRTPDSLTDEQCLELQQEFTVALGLALRR